MDSSLVWRLNARSCHVGVPVTDKPFRLDNGGLAACGHSAPVPGYNLSTWHARGIALWQRTSGRWRLLLRWIVVTAFLVLALWPLQLTLLMNVYR
jgi:hypothetical protein